MGISPIVGLTPLPIKRPVESDIGLPPMERIENSTRTGDETYSPSDGRPADSSEEEFENLADEQAAESNAREEDRPPGRQISFFA